ncbi:MAG: hypothetical protein KatS3mg105_0949 [Gemmatales bacterium]|nr:MAG: hypothetical protein KatS3mg105_0949 [Gemmatales bacterium]
MERLDELLLRQADGELTPDEANELEALLRSSAEARAKLVEDCLLEVHLHKALTQQPVVAIPARQRYRGVVKRVAMVFATAAAVMTIYFLVNHLASRSTAAVAVVADVSGTAQCVHNDGRQTLLQPGSPIALGDRVVVGSEEDDLLAIAFPDRSRIILSPGTILHFRMPQEGEGKRVHIEQGVIQVSATKQPADRPMVLTTDHARVIVLGTRFRMYREAEASRVELYKGKVRMVQEVDGQTVEMEEGSVAVATAKAAPLQATTLSVGTATLQRTFLKGGQYVAFSEDGKFLAAGRNIGPIKIWSVPDGEVRGELNWRRGPLFGLFHSAEGRFLTALGENGTIGRWDLRTKHEVIEAIDKHHSRARSGAMSSDGKWLALAGPLRNARIWNRQNVADVFQFHSIVPSRGKPWCVAFSRTPRLFAYGQWDGTVSVRDMAADQVIHEFRLRHTPTKIALSDNGRFLAVFSIKDGIHLVDMQKGDHHELWPAESAHVSSLQFSRDGRFLLAGMNDGTARVWSIAETEMRLVIDTNFRRVRHAAFSPDGKYIATASDSHVKLWSYQLP